jgi:kynureninase
MKYENTASFAIQMDTTDEVRTFRGYFIFPELGGTQALYFTGNSLGLQPIKTKDYIQTELNDWGRLAVEGHFYALNPWYSYHEMFAKPIASIVGAQPEEVVVMNQLTVNLHLLMVSFYRPKPNRFKILCESRAFPSDQYAMESQVRFHGYDPDDAIIEVLPRAGEYCLRTEDIIERIEMHADELALVLFGGVNYVTGQLFDMEKIAQAARKHGIIVGFDLAHAAGNVKLNLHDWNVDFACWCSYKYMNSGPGGVAGVFVHEKHHRENLPRLAGWWGHDKDNRFKMEKGFRPIPSAEGWQLSNAPVLSMAAHKASLDIFSAAGMDNLIAKSKLLTGFLEFIINDINQAILNSGDNRILEIITPDNPDERGCQLSIIAHGRGKELYQQLISKAIIVDWREPNVIRIAPVPLYNSFMDVYKLGLALKNIILNK